MKNNQTNKINPDKADSMLSLKTNQDFNQKNPTRADLKGKKLDPDTLIPEIEASVEKPGDTHGENHSGDAGGTDVLIANTPQ
ncbi:MAG: hypothetical protein NTX03_09090 [Bacteroidetes bacterium]|nr:hypothetical protein [Bacteroidota bacterium]